MGWTRILLFFEEIEDGENDERSAEFGAWPVQGI